MAQLCKGREGLEEQPQLQTQQCTFIGHPSCTRSYTGDLTWVSDVKPHLTPEHWVLSEHSPEMGLLNLLLRGGAWPAGPMPGSSCTLLGEGGCGAWWCPGLQGHAEHGVRPECPPWGWATVSEAVLFCPAEQAGSGDINIYPGLAASLPCDLGLVTSSLLGERELRVAASLALSPSSNQRPSSLSCFISPHPS